MDEETTEGLSPSRVRDHQKTWAIITDQIRRDLGD
jgi:hypothetical protein